MHSQLEQIFATLEAVPTGMILTNLLGEILSINSQIERIFGYSRHELHNQPVEILVPLRFQKVHSGYRAGFVKSPVTRPMGAGRELYGLHKQGFEVPIEIGLNPIDTAEGRYILSSVVDMTEHVRAQRELKELNAELSMTLKERELLLQEVHHRVKNNLQMLSSLINMQMRKLKQDSARQALEEYQTRLQSIALVHEQLYQSGNHARVPLLGYLRSLLNNIFYSCGVEPSIHLEAKGPTETTLPIDRAIPVGLILNELITNAVKHAFAAGDSGRVWAEVEETPETVRIFINDNGRGLPPDLDTQSGITLGLQVVHILAEQISGTLTAAPLEPGTSMLVEFPKDGG